MDGSTLTALLLTAIIVEGIVRGFREAFGKLVRWPQALSFFLASVVAASLCVTLKLDLFTAVLGVKTTIAGQLITAVFVARGSNAVHQFIDLLDRILGKRRKR